MPRPTPFDLVFTRAAESVFPAIRTALEQTGQDPADRDGFLMVPDAVALLHELRPEEGLGEGMDQLVALVHHAYLLWDAGLPTVPVSAREAAALLDAPASDTGPAERPPRAYYAQFEERQVWARVVNGLPAEPMDGCFVHAAGEVLRVLGIFGLRPEREGFSAVETAGPRPHALERPDGSRLFSPVLAGGTAAGLYSLAGGEELLELGWRTRVLAGDRAVPA
jgi:hypothetical protein